MMNALFHCNDLNKFQHTAQNIKNLRKHDDVDKIELLLNGPTVTLAMDINNKSLFKDLFDLNVTIALCNNALRAFDIDPASVGSEFIIVPTGVYELLQKQNEGYLYIKP